MSPLNIVRVLSAASLLCFLIVALDDSRRFQIFHSLVRPGHHHGQWWLYRWLVVWPYRAEFELPGAYMLSAALFAAGIFFSVVATIVVFRPWLQTAWAWLLTALGGLLCAYFYAFSKVMSWHESLLGQPPEELVYGRGTRLLALSATLMLAATVIHGWKISGRCALSSTNEA